MSIQFPNIDNGEVTVHPIIDRTNLSGLTLEQTRVLLNDMEDLALTNFCLEDADEDAMNTHEATSFVRLGDVSSDLAVRELGHVLCRIHLDHGQSSIISHLHSEARSMLTRVSHDRVSFYYLNSSED